jgi:hypothetical protein
MFTKQKLISMNNNKQYSSSGWIKNIEDNLDDKKLYNLYATKNVSLSSGREYIALPSDKILSDNDYIKYNIFK